MSINNFKLAIAGLVLLTSSLANATAILVGVTGDGATTPESLFTINTTDASSTFLMSLGNGEDGETIGFNSKDGLLYHSSGIVNGDRFWESINIANSSIVASGQFTGPEVSDENLAMAYDAVSDRFLVSDRDENIFSTTMSGDATLLGNNGLYLKGLAFMGSTLVGAESGGSLLYTLDALSGGILSSINITIGGIDADGFNGLTVNPETGELWGIVKSNGRHLARIDTVTGVATSFGKLSDKFAGIAFVVNPTSVPEPSALVILVLGIGTILARRFKQS